jgi:hypothetical protein
MSALAEVAPTLSSTNAKRGIRMEYRVVLRFIAGLPLAGLNTERNK